MPHPRITSKRQIIQVVLILIALLLPFVTVGGNPFLRMDIGLRTFFLAGAAVRIDQFYLVLLATLLGALLFLLITVVLGRVWCGWACPQTVFNDLAELVVERCKGFPVWLAGVIEHLTAAVIAAGVSFNLLCWFMAPAGAWAALMKPAGSPVVSGSFIAVTLFGYLNLILVKRSFCRSYCPYGRLQVALTDSATLNLSFFEETRDRCLKCGACVRICPMDIDIRNGFQIECINCGRCIDACRGVMERRPDGIGLIDYCFGSSRSTRFVPGRKTIALASVTLLLTVGLLWGLTGRSQSGFVVQRIATAEPRTLPDGNQAQPWKAMIGNRSESPVRYSLRIADGEARNARLLGPVDDILIAPNEHREITFLISIKPQQSPVQPVRLQLFSNGRQLSAVSIKP